MADQIKKRSFERTAAAIVEFDAGAAARNLAWAEACTDQCVHRAEQGDERALRQVQKAFHEDTSDINRMENCLRVDIAFMRQCAREAGK